MGAFFIGRRSVTARFALWWDSPFSLCGSRGEDEGGNMGKTGRGRCDCLVMGAAGYIGSYLAPSARTGLSGDCRGAAPCRLPPGVEFRLPTASSRSHCCPPWPASTPSSIWCTPWGGGRLPPAGAAGGEELRPPPAPPGCAASSIWAPSSRRSATAVTSTPAVIAASCFGRRCRRWSCAGIIVGPGSAAFEVMRIWCSTCR